MNCLPEGDIQSDFIEPQDWRYEMRRDVQEIIRGVYLGPYSCSKNLALLRSHKITHIVCIRDPIERAIVRPQFPELFQYHVIELSDSPFDNLIPHIRGIKEFVDCALKSGSGGSGRVLVHCNNGISCAPALVIAYVMASGMLNYHTAFPYVLQRRCCVNPNEGFQLQLQAYEAIICAKAQYSGVVGEHLQHPKRNSHCMEDD